MGTLIAVKKMEKREKSRKKGGKSEKNKDQKKNQEGKKLHKNKIEKNLNLALKNGEINFFLPC